MKTTTNPVERERSPVQSKRSTLFLFARDLRKTWPSYVVAALLGVLSGAIASVLLEGIFVIEGLGEEGESIERVSNSLLVDFFFLAVTTAFLINLVFNEDYAARYKHDNMSRRLGFLRSLPIRARDLVMSRALSSLLSLAVSAPPFFVVLYLLSDAGGGRLPVEVYVPFATIWTAYSLVVGGFCLYVWLGFSGREDLWISLSFPALLLLVAVTSNFALGTGLVVGSVELAQDRGLLAAAALIPGAAVFALWMLAATRRLERREL